MRIAGFFDIETEGWDKFVVGGFYDGTDYFESWSEDEYADKLLSIEGEIWAWNGGLYDTVWFADILDRRLIKFDAVYAGGRIIKLSVGRLVVRDAAALIPMTQKKAAQMAGEELTKDVGLDCHCGLSCGGYCRIRRDMPIDDRVVIGRYLNRDCESGHRILSALFEHAEREDYVLTSTVGGSAWATAKKRIPDIGNARWERARDYFIARDGYFGGRVYVGQLTAAEGHRYDINSAYPAALSTVALPHGQYAVADDDVVKVYDRRRPGIYHATVDVPRDCLIPPLPYRTDSGRVLYPVGRFSGAWALNELEYAISTGVKLVALKRAIVWSDATIIFADFMNELFSVRAKWGKKHAFGNWQKWFANSLTGGFAMRPERYQLHAHPTPEEIRCCNPFDADCASLGCLIGACSGRCHSWEPIGRGNLWVEKQFRLSDRSHIQWAAYLTANCRITWHKGATLAGHANVLYGDTDSLRTLNRNLDLRSGDELGQWAYEGPIQPWYEMIDYSWVQHPGWECVAPKTYLSFDGEGFDAKGKGLPHIDVDVYRRFRDGETIEDKRGVYGLRTTSRSVSKDINSLFQRKTIKRSRHARDRIDGCEYVADRRVCSDGIHTEPITVAEQRRREQRGSD